MNNPPKKMSDASPNSGDFSNNTSSASTKAETPTASDHLIEVAAAFPLNDVGNAKRFGTYFDGHFIFVPRVGWHYWVGTHWQLDKDLIDVRDAARRVSAFIILEAEFLRINQSSEAPNNLSDPPDKKKIDNSKHWEAHLRYARESGNRRRIDAILKEAQVDHHRSFDQLDKDPLKINTRSATLRFWYERGDPNEGMSGEARFESVPNAPEDNITKCVSVAFEPEATAPKFLAFLEKIQPSAEMRQFLARWFGLSMTGIKEQKLAFFHGSGANGKSVLLEVVARILDGYAATAKIESLTGRSKRSGADATPDLVPLIGARMVRASEPDEGERFKEGLIKELTGGEPILVRALNSGFVEVTPEFKITISGNHKPEIRGTDDGIWRRVMLVPFDVKIPSDQRRDFEELVKDLMTEGPGILNWLVNGLLDYLDQGLRVPLQVLQATNQYQSDSDPIGSFLAENTIVDGSDSFLKASKLVKAFNFWLVEEGGASWGTRSVSNKFRDLAGRWRHPHTDMTFVRAKSGVTGYRGIRLTEAFVDRYDTQPDENS